MPIVLLGCLYSTLEWASLAKAEGACRVAPWLFSEIASQQNRSSLSRKKKKKSLGCSDHRYMGKTPNLLSLQVESLHLPSWLVPKTGSLLPTRVPRMTWKKSKHISGIGSASLHWNLNEWSVRGWQGMALGGRELELVWNTWPYMPWKSNQPDPHWGLFTKVPSCFPFHALCFVCLSFDYMVLMESEVKQHHRRKWTEIVASLTKPNPRNSGNIHCQPPSEISSLIARPKRFGVTCGPPWAEPVPGLCLLFQSSVSNIDLKG